jgi:hypothetical protein
MVNIYSHIIMISLKTGWSETITIWIKEKQIIMDTYRHIITISSKTSWRETSPYQSKTYQQWWIFTATSP